MLHQRLHDPELSATEAAFLEALSPVFTDLEESAQATLYVEGAGKLLTLGPRRRRVGAQPADGDARAPRDRCWASCARRSSAGHPVAVRIGAENEVPALRSLALVAASYGLPQRTLGAVSVIGPLRMDYGHAIRTVREAAAQLSSFVADVYDER